MKITDSDAYLQRLTAARQPYHRDYLAMFSSVLGGIVTEPVWMTVPMDDHMVHRGDGVFEAFKCVDGNLYNMAAHLDRLHTSADAVCLAVPGSDAEIAATVIGTARAGGRRECMIRLFVSRGPGGFGVNPYESPGAQLYVVATVLKPSFMSAHPEGARVATSTIRPKDPPFSRVKSTNYIVNVLMKKECEDRGVDFVAGFDRQGNLTESYTENLGVVTEDGRLVFPRLEGILRGTTMIRVMELAGPLVEAGRLRSVGTGDIGRETIRSAREMLVVGTTIDVASVVEYDGEPVGDGKPGAVARALGERLREDMRTNRALLTEVFPGAQPATGTESGTGRPRQSQSAYGPAGCSLFRRG